MTFIGDLTQIHQIIMKEETIDHKLMEGEVITVGHHTIMTEEFVQIYREALEFSNLHIHVNLKYRNVSIYETQHLHQVYTVGNTSLPHLVLLHGYGGTSLTYVRMFEHLVNNFQVHALDTFGIGLSSRGNWNDDMTREQVISYYIEALEQWRKKVGIDSFVLAGHSFGGFLSVHYLQKYPQRVKQLILISPAGTARLTDEYIKQRAQNAKFFFCVAEIVYNMNIRPSRLMDTCFIGSKFIDRILKNRLKLPENEQDVWKKYLKKICKQKECSEKGFYRLFDWPLQPQKSIQMIIQEMKPQIKIDFLYGDQDWMQPDGAKRLAKDFKNIHVHTIENAGHQMLFDNPVMVSHTICKAV